MKIYKIKIINESCAQREGRRFTEKDYEVEGDKEEDKEEKEVVIEEEEEEEEEHKKEEKEEKEENMSGDRTSKTMVLLIVSIVLSSLWTTSVNGAGLKCDAVRPDFEAQGFPLSDIPKEPISLREMGFSVKSVCVYRAKKRDSCVRIRLLKNSIKFAFEKLLRKEKIRANLRYVNMYAYI
ncbi:glypican-6 isoform X1 [Vespula maculifrons]|uniref:Glypican-6 isoform X1 n=1 Tax=Vespula maculifrons TaxID=7453 RepID=A0ABD2CKY4_VESMC